MFSSFNPFALKQMEYELPHVPRALLVSNVREGGNAWYLREMLYAPILKIHMLNLDQRMATPEVIAFWRKRGMPLSIWTIVEEKKGRELLKQGVNGIISDLDPASPSWRIQEGPAFSEDKT